MDNPIFNRVISVLKKELTKEEWIEFSEHLDNGADLQEPVDEYVMTIAPELFCGDGSDMPEELLEEKR